MEYLSKNVEGRFIHRWHGILLLIENDNNNCAKISEIFHNSPRFLSNWVHKVNKAGNIEVLRDKPKTIRVARLNHKQEAH